MFILIEYVIGFKLQNVTISGMYRAHYTISMKLPIWKARKNFKNNWNKLEQIVTKSCRTEKKNSSTTVMSCWFANKAN